MWFRRREASEGLGAWVDAPLQRLGAPTASPSRLILPFTCASFLITLLGFHEHFDADEKWPTAVKTCARVAIFVGFYGLLDTPN